MHTDDPPAACENCATPLAGAYCHACGQHATNPLRHVGHAIEDFFESFWHLDGRVFRTLRDLFVPARVACHYLAGRRVRYIPPLRLFVILTVITFFVGQVTIGSGGGSGESSGPVRVGTNASRTAITFDSDRPAPPALNRAATEADVEAAVERERAKIAAARTRVQGVPGASAAMDAAEKELREKADARIAVLRSRAAQASPAAPAGPTPDAPAAPAPGAAAPRTGTAPEPVDPVDPVDPEANAREGMQSIVKEFFGPRLRDPTTPWHEHDNPVDLAWLPAFGDRWFNHRIANAERNSRLVAENGERYLLSLALASVPSALFVLVPVFALLLKLFYLRSGRGYLEHLVVALYSHAYLLLVLLASFVLAALEPGGAARGIGTVLVGAGQFVLWASVPVYLLVMQRRVYAQRWWITIGKFLLLGFAYQFLVLAAVVYTVFAALTSGN